MLELCREMNSGSQRDKMRLIAAEQLHRMHRVYESAGYFLSSDEHDEVMDSTFRFCEAYTRLSLESASRGVLCWNLVNKFHMMVHMSLASRFLNPLTVWTYGFEDLVGRVKRVAVASSSGLSVTKYSKSVMLKYRRILYLACKKVG